VSPSGRLQRKQAAFFIWPLSPHRPRGIEDSLIKIKAGHRAGGIGCGIQHGGLAMSDSPIEKFLIVFFRFTMAWTFLYAASHQVFVPSFSVVGFLSHTKTFHDVFVVFTTPTMAPITTFMVEYGHLLIGLSLLTGLMVRVSASFGVLLMAIYWFAHMDWPFIENTNNLIVDYHVVYAGVLVYLVVKKAGHVWGLDGWAEKLQLVREHPGLKPLFA
jgi:thiosulfate dehydrogenase (quinone) large subunit